MYAFELIYNILTCNVFVDSINTMLEKESLNDTKL